VGGVAAPAAIAGTTDTGGSVTLTDNSAFRTAEGNAGLALVPGGTAVVAVTNGVITITLPVTGGNARLNPPDGTLDLGGATLTFENSSNGKSVEFTNVGLNVESGQLSGLPAGGTHQVALADVSGSPSYTVNGSTQTLSTDSIVTDPAGASYLDKALCTGFYVSAEQQTVAGLSATFTVSG
jgi:hypothetical protein